MALAAGLESLPTAQLDHVAMFSDTCDMHALLQNNRALWRGRGKNALVRRMRTLEKMCSRRMLVDARLLAARHSASEVVSGSVWRGPVGESEVSVCVGGRDGRPVSTHRPPLEMVTSS